MKPNMVESNQISIGYSDDSVGEKVVGLKPRCWLCRKGYEGSGAGDVRGLCLYVVSVDVMLLKG